MENKMIGLSLLAFILFISSYANGDITCQEALVCVIPCKPYLSSSGPATPTVPCCEGVQKVASQATSHECRKEVCECFKKAAAGMSVDLAKLKKLPELCQIKVPVPLDPSVDCSKLPN